MRNTFKFASVTALATALCAIGAPAFAEDAEADTIIVQAQRVNATHVENGGTAGVLGNKPAEDLPFNLRSYDETLILNQQPKSLGEVLQNDPTIRTTYGYGNAQEAFIIRGFQLSGDDIGLNGLYGITPRQLVAPELFGSVEVLNGASAFLYGAAPGGSGQGGAVNLQLKRAGPSDLNRVTFGYTSDANFQGSFDVSRRFGDGSFGIRINGAYGGGDVAVDNENRKTRVLGAAVDWNSGPVRISADIAYQRVIVDHLRGKVIVDGLASIPDVPKASANYAQDFTYTNLRDIFGTLNIEYDFAPNATLWAKGGFRDGSEKGWYSAINLTDAETGDGYNYPGYVPRTDNNEAVEIGARVKLGTKVTQEFVLGGNMTWQVNRNSYDFRTSYNTNLYDTPDAALPSTVWFADGDLDNPPKLESYKFSSIFASDTIGFWDDRILVTGGLRLQRMQISGFNRTSGARTSYYDENAVTPVVGVVIKPAPTISLYANRIEALQKGDTVTVDPDFTNSGDTLAPYKTVQYEVGGKVKVGPVYASLSLYQIKKPNGYTVDNGDGTFTYGYFGRQRNRGVEVTLNGEITKGLRLISGFAVSDAKQLDTGSASTSDKHVRGIPDWTANANVEWDLPMVPGVTVTGRVTYTGKQWVDTANTLRIPDSTIFNLGTRYVLAAGNVPVTFRFNVDNIANKRYWASAYDVFYASLLQGQPRTFKASISADF